MRISLDEMIDYSKVDEFKDLTLNRLIVYHVLDGNIIGIDNAGNYTWIITVAPGLSRELKEPVTDSPTDSIGSAWGLVEKVYSRYPEEVFIGFNLEMMKRGGWIAPQPVVCRRICRSLLTSLHSAGLLVLRKDP